MPFKGKRSISLLDVTFGSLGSPLLIVGIFYGLDIWVSSARLLPYPLNLSGIAFFIFGVSIGLLCLKVVLALPEESILVTLGPWARVRHPIYIAGLFVNLGAVMMIGTLLLILQFVGYALLEFLVETPLEEKGLRRSFPEEYEVYSKQVPRWIPRIRG